MNLWITLLLPTLGIGIVAKIVLYYFNIEARDKIIPLVVVTAGQIAGVVLIVMLLNGMGINTFLILASIFCVISNFIQTSCHDGTWNLGLGYKTTFFISYVVYFFAVIASFYYLIL